jgi:ribonuclease VapC
MVIDSSAVLSVLLGEPEASAFIMAITQDPKRLIGSVSVLECAVVIETRKGPAGARELDLLLHASSMEIVSLTKEQVQLARDAYSRFGKGRHPAALNLGDCCSYALAHFSGEALLFKGEDFSQTDIPCVGLRGA